ncbi:hypothetical protein [Flammeovirga sp. SJP92]|uniref:hypothetical protein n=1 Tax=Flammeovirga sp. SJP92 TaxID=1775430 RepID=UPI0007881A35|nr:hypothetical protein [Flammeovirga sp. SJP92]KXX72332.1 hypothetical protein AVL50_01640 [Flammeovirga sp. SJP92]
MSSHHIVRDDQEPAVLVGKVDESQFPLLFSLLEWSPIVIATAQSYEKLLSLDIKIDIIFYQEHKEEINKNMTRQNEFFELVHYHDALLETVLKWLSSQKHFALNYITNVLDTSSQELLKDQEYINTLVVFADDFKYVLNKNSPFEKWIPKGVEITFDGAVQESENIELQKEGKYTVINDGIIKVMHQNKLIIGEKMKVAYDR